MSADERPPGWTRLSRARGPRVLVTRVSMVWFGAFAGLIVAGGFERNDRLTSAVAAIVLVTTLFVLVRTWSAGLFTNGTDWELRGVLGRTRIRRSSVTAVGLTDQWGLGGPIRVLCIGQGFEDPVTFAFIAWGNQMNSFHYGAGVSGAESPRQAQTLDALRRDAQLNNGHESHTG